MFCTVLISKFAGRLTMLVFTLLFVSDLATLNTQKNPLDSIISAHPEWGDWTRDPDRYELQLLFTEIDDDDGQRQLTTHRWGGAADNYFYPASTVKLPVAALALEWLNEQGIAGLDRNTPLLTGKGRHPQTARLTDTTAPAGLPTVAHYVTKIFLVSDNESYNRLYELLGQDYINRRLLELGLSDTRIIHRVGVIGFDREGNRYHNPVMFRHGDSILYQRAERYADWTDLLQPNRLSKGVGYLDGEGVLVPAPFDFSQKNYVSLDDLHGILLRIMEPMAFPGHQRFNLSPEDYHFLRRSMRLLPRESQLPDYADLPDNYVKFWLFGDRPETDRLPDHLSIYNKVGLAYGYLSDVAYVVDREAGVHYAVSAVIHVNENQVYNDGKYEYDTVGFPLFGELGRAIHAYVTGE